MELFFWENVMETHRSIFLLHGMPLDILEKELSLFNSSQNQFWAGKNEASPMYWWHKWKGINRKQSTRQQHLSRVKCSVFFFLQFFLVVMKHSNLYMGLVLPSGGWQSLIGAPSFQSIVIDPKPIHLMTDLSSLIFRSCRRWWWRTRSGRRSSPRTRCCRGSGDPGALPRTRNLRCLPPWYHFVNFLQP